MNTDKITTTAGVATFINLFATALVQAGYFTPDLEPIALAGASLSVAVLGYYSNKRSSKTANKKAPMQGP
jgi:multisubunit Na+/H+ antiporter MnhB subunit